MPAQTGGKKKDVAKPRAVKASGGTASPSNRPKTANATAGGDASTQLRPRAVWEELKKVVWPSLDDLSRMTGVVIVTVFIFAGLVGAADQVLAWGVSHVYNTTTSGSGPTPTP